MSTWSPRLTCSRSAATTAVELRIWALRATTTPLELLLANVVQPTIRKEREKIMISFITCIRSPNLSAALALVTERTQNLLLQRSHFLVHKEARIWPSRVKLETVGWQELFKRNRLSTFNIRLDEPLRSRRRTKE